MTLEAFTRSIRDSNPPSNISKNLQALWHDANGDWDRAHDIVQQTSGQDGDWIHAYLHRKEGDNSNAGYWYSRVGRSRPNISLEEEWELLARHLLNN